MRTAGLLVTIAVGCGGASPAPRPPTIARAPLPPYGGAMVTGPCTIHLGSVSRDERARRLRAMATFLPEGSHIELSELGDRATRISTPIPQRRMNGKLAERVARILLHHTAELFGVTEEPTRFLTARTEDGWVVEMDVGLRDPPPWIFPSPARLVMLLADGVARVGLVYELVPTVAPCSANPPKLDDARATAVLVGRRMPSRRPERTIGPDDLLSPVMAVVLSGHEVTWVALVGVGDRVRSAREPREPLLAEFRIDPFTLAIVGERGEFPGFPPYPNDPEAPGADAMRVFGIEPD